jgi:hypothetical protein
MRQTEQLQRLNDLAKLILDQRLARLQACAAARQGSLQRLQDLAPKPAEDADPFEQATRLMRYEVWADTRRREINMLLARQTVGWLEARSEAQGALGRADVLRKLMKK